MKKKIAFIIPVILIALIFTCVFIYTGDYYHADKTALEAMESDMTVNVSHTDYGWYFDGPSRENTLIFYPGGKVEEIAYAPLLHRLAAKGIDVCLISMPFRLAILGINKADDLIKQNDSGKIFIGGHSLGGVASAKYAAAHPDSIDGLILLASYPTEKLDSSINTVLIYGSEDKVLNMEKYEASKELIPENSQETIIEGGNHAQFGSYGPQEGDGKAGISADEQTEETADIIVSVINNNN